MSSRRIITLLLALVLCLGCAVPMLASCNGGGDTSDTQGGETEGSTPTTGNGKVSHTVTVKTMGGMPLANINFFVYKGEDDLITYGKTDENGKATVEMASGSGYTLELSGVPEGYEVQDRYSFVGNAANVVLTSRVIEDGSLSGVTYEVGDVMRDFTAVTTDGSIFKLSEELKEKDLVMINFWYTTCSWCITEFPFMQTAWEKYSDEIGIIALDHYTSDTEQKIKLFQQDYGLTFPMAKDYTGLQGAVDIQGYPTTIFVDRYGVICAIESGALTSDRQFDALYDHFCGENYNQQLLTDLSVLTPTEMPDEDMPASEEMNEAFSGGTLNATFTEETESNDAEYSWPFLIGELEDGSACVYPSNSYKSGSFATMHVTLDLAVGEALGFDWFASTELGMDILYVLVNGEAINLISGDSAAEGFKSCYSYVAETAGTYKFSFIYLKDSDTDYGKDTVYLKNLRIVDKSEIDTATYVPRDAATNKNANGLGFGNYVDVFYNEEDGYYHVGSTTGPLLLADLMNPTPYNEVSVNLLGYNGYFYRKDGTDLYGEYLIQYCNYAVNSAIYGVCPVTEELKTLLVEALRMAVPYDEDEDQWLQVCKYYDAYGGAPERSDPIKGLAPFSAFVAEESLDGETVYNEVYYDRGGIVPRGFLYRFTPERSGVYRIVSQSEYEVDAWIFLEDRTEYFVFEGVQRFYDNATNCDMTVYFEEGVDYYIDIAFYDTGMTGRFTFTVEYLAESMDFLRTAAPGYFTYWETENGTINDLDALGIDVALGDDGYYHELRANGSLGSIVYADFLYQTAVFSASINEMIEKGAFDFSKTEGDQYILSFIKVHGEGTVDYLKTLWGEFYEEYAELYELEDVLAGIYHGNGPDLTDEMKAYAALAYGKEAGELEGFVPVDEELAALLWQLMDKFTFAGVENSWLKVCYYFEYLGPEAAE